MYTSLNVGRMVAIVANTLSRNVLPHVSDPKAKQDADMCMAVLHWAAQLAPLEQRLYVQECKEMSELFTALGGLFKEDRSPEGVRIQERGEKLKGIQAPGLPAYEELTRHHSELSRALIPTLEDLYALDREGNSIAAQGLAKVHAHLARRTGRDLETYLGAPSSGAMVGREAD